MEHKIDKNRLSGIRKELEGIYNNRMALSELGNCYKDKRYDIMYKVSSVINSEFALVLAVRESRQITKKNITFNRLHKMQLIPDSEFTKVLNSTIFDLKQLVQ